MDQAKLIQVTPSPTEDEDLSVKEHMSKLYPGTTEPHVLPKVSVASIREDSQSEDEEGIDNPAFQTQMSEIAQLAKQENAALYKMSLHQLAREGDLKKMTQVLESLAGEQIQQQKLFKVTVNVAEDDQSILYRRVNECDEDGYTPLHYAARYNHSPIVHLLAEYGADVNFKGEDDIGPLHFAARYKRNSTPASIQDRKTSIDVLTVEIRPRERRKSHIETESIITFLIQQGAEPNAEDTYGMTPLHYAAMRGNVIVAEELLKCLEVIVDCKDKTFMTPLHAACSNGHLEVAELLFAKGADLHAMDEQKNTPLHLAAEEGHLNIVKRIMQLAQNKPGMIIKMLSGQNYKNNTALHLAVDNGQYKITKFLLKYGADVNIARTMLNTPLHLACKSGDVRIAQLLLNHGADVECRNAMQATPLHWACAQGHHAVVKYLHEKGVDMEARDKDGCTPLLVAASEGRVKTVQTLLSSGATVTATDKHDRTAIHLAALFNHFAVLKVLLADQEVVQFIDKGDRYNATPLHVAAKNGFLETCQLLLDLGAEIDVKNEEEKTPLHFAAVNGRTAIVRELVRRSKLIVADEDGESNTPLHIAAMEGNEMVVRVLLEAGADIAARNSVMWTPLDCAAANGWERTVTILLDSDAQVDPVDKTKTTPLHLASSKGHVEVVRLLLKRGAKIDLLDHEHMNCLDLAINNGKKEVAMAILEHRKWKVALRNSRIVTDSHGKTYRETPLRNLIQRLPDVAEFVFNRCTDVAGDTNKDDYSITFNYEFLDDAYCSWNNQGKPAFNLTGKLSTPSSPYSKDSNIIKENHPLMIMAESERVQLLSHPLVISLLRQKWISFGRYVYYSALLMYIIFLAFLTTYIVTVPPPYQVEFINETQIFEDCPELNITENYNVRLAQLCYIGILVMIVLHAFKELYQIKQRGLGYVAIDNFLEWVTYIGVLILVYDFSDCSRSSGIRQPLQWEIGSGSIFLAWFNLVMMVRKFPTLGIYVVMFTDVLHTFMQFLAVFFLFICAFGLAFFALFQNQEPFNTPLLAMIKTTVMMVGEFDYTDMFNQPDSNDTKVFYKSISYVLFVAFVLLMTIIIMNLLIGLAVDDIKGVQDKAVLKKYAMQAHLVLHVEQALPEKLRRHFMIGRQTLYPNQKDFLEKIKRLISQPTQLSVSTIARQVRREQRDDGQGGQGRQMQDHVVHSLDKLKRRVDGIQSDQKRLHSMIQAVINHFDIQWEDEDEFRDLTNRNVKS